MNVKLGILTTHPIQYQVPWFRLLARTPGVDLTVYYCQIPDARQQGDGFGVSFQWDVPLLDGYSHRVLRNVARQASVSHFDGCNTPEIRSIVAREGFDAFIVNGWVVRSCLQALFACRLAGVPCLVRGESNALRRRPLPIRLMHRLLLRQYAACLVIGRSNREFYLQNGVPEKHLFWTPYGVENERFAAGARAFAGDRMAWRRRWGIPENACVFLFSGKLIPKKRPEDVLHALALLADQASLPEAAHLLIAGEGERMVACRQFAAEHHLPVSFAGFLNQSEMPAAYAAADCLVLPSDAGETWGLVVNEAMACGLPAIVSDRVGCQADLVDDTTGRVFRCGDVAGLAGCIRNLTADPIMRRAMADAARLRVGAYSVEAVVAGTLAAIRHVSPVAGGLLQDGGGCRA
jgi:glycosyltransferase involved in cell wall biosynthesis